jgi:hypothetical protein
MATCILSLIILSWTFHSDNGQYTGEAIYTGGTELTTVSFTLCDRGVKLYSLSKPDAITFFISNSGSVFAASEHELFCYDVTGKILFRKRLEYPNGFGFSPDNSVFFASDRDALTAYAANGNIVYSLAPCRLFASTEDASKIAALTNDTLLVYENGRLTSTRILETPYARSLYFEDRGTIKVDHPGFTETITIKDDARLEEP